MVMQDLIPGSHSSVNDIHVYNIKQFDNEPGWTEISSKVSLRYL